MDMTLITKLRGQLSLHFACIAFLTAMLVAVGSGTYILPLVIFFFGFGGYIFVDRLGLFALGRIGSYFGMTFATTIAIATYLYNVIYRFSEAGQLTAVAGLLVFPEAVLFLQKKNLRVYEQLSIFLMLEMIVAALVNDNILFGILLTPIMLLWVSALFLSSRYAALLRLDSSIEEPVPLLAEIIYSYIRRQVTSPKNESPIVQSSLVVDTDYQLSRSLRRLLQALPLGVGALVFSGLFFYLLPRTMPASFPQGLGVRPRIGLPPSLTIGEIGRLLADPTEVMHVSFKTFANNQDYPLFEQPYLRARVFDEYRRTERNNQGEWIGRNIGGFYALNGIESVQDRVEVGADLVTAEFDVEKTFSAGLCCFGTNFKTPKKQSIPLNVDRFSMVLQSLDESNRAYGSSLTYELGVANFKDGKQIPITPARAPSLVSGERVFDLLTSGTDNFVRLLPYLNELIRSKNIEPFDQIGLCDAIVERLGDSDEFSYTLDLSPPSEPGWDPIEDFVLNQKKGHCQYFASSMVAMLRLADVPCRIVVGYTPSDYNRIGKYFQVRQLDAHSWVEVLVQREQLVGTRFEEWLSKADYYWVRYDPTPTSDEVVEQDGQAIDYAEKLWNDYVVNASELSGENSFYNPVAENSKGAYQSLVDSTKLLIEDLRSGQIGVRGRGMSYFAVPVAIAVAMIGVAAFGCWRLYIALPRFAPRLANRLGIGKRGDDTFAEPFFKQCMEILSARGFQREHYETPLEFTAETARVLSAQTGDPKIAEALKMLTLCYYDLRYGDAEQLTPKRQTDVKQAIHFLQALPTN